MDNSCNLVYKAISSSFISAGITTSISTNWSPTLSPETKPLPFSLNNLPVDDFGGTWSVTLPSSVGTSTAHPSKASGGNNSNL